MPKKAINLKIVQRIIGKGLEMQMVLTKNRNDSIDDDF